MRNLLSLCLSIGLLALWMPVSAELSPSSEDSVVAPTTNMSSTKNLTPAPLPLTNPNPAAVYQGKNGAGMGNGTYNTGR